MYVYVCVCACVRKFCIEFGYIYLNFYVNFRMCLCLFLSLSQNMLA